MIAAGAVDDEHLTHRPRTPPPQRADRAAGGAGPRARRDHLGRGRVRTALHRRRPRPRRGARQAGGGLPGQRRAPQPDPRGCAWSCSTLCCPALPRRRAGRSRTTTSPRVAPRWAGTSTTSSTSTTAACDVRRRRHGPRRRRCRGDGADACRGPRVRRAGPDPDVVLNRLDQMYARYQAEQLVTLVYLLADPHATSCRRQRGPSAAGPAPRRRQPDLTAALRGRRTSGRRLRPSARSRAVALLFRRHRGHVHRRPHRAPR